MLTYPGTKYLKECKLNVIGKVEERNVFRIYQSGTLKNGQQPQNLVFSQKTKERKMKL